MAALRKIVLAAVGLCCAATDVFAQSGDGFVGVFRDAAGTQSCTAVPALTGTTLYVVGKVAGTTAAGITGAEFRIEVGNPIGWYLIYTPPEGAIALGDPLSSGVNIAFRTCAEAVAGNIGLGTISVFNVNGVTTSLLVKRHSQPSNPEFTCPLFVACDAPYYSKTCMATAGIDSCALGTSKAQRLESTDPAVFVSMLDAATPGSGPQATFLPIASVVGTLPVFDAWSPVGTRIAFCRGDSLFALDPSLPSTPPWLVMPNVDAYTAWSPDGEWIAALRRSADDRRDGLSTIVAAPVSGGPAVTLVKAEIDQFRWAPNGNLYFWETRTGTRHAVPPPESWQPPSQSAAAAPMLVPRMSVRGGIGTRIFRTEPTEGETEFPALSGLGPCVVLPRATVPNSELYLVDAYGATGVKTLIVDLGGSIVVDFGTQTGVAGFGGTSVSSDASYVVGQNVVDDGTTTLAATLFVAGADGSWRVTVAGTANGSHPALSASESFVAFEDPTSGELHVGTLAVSFP